MAVVTPKRRKRSLQAPQQPSRSLPSVQAVEQGGDPGGPGDLTDRGGHAAGVRGLAEGRGGAEHPGPQAAGEEAARGRERTREGTGGGGLGCARLAGSRACPSGGREDLRVPGVQVTQAGFAKTTGSTQPRSAARGRPESLRARPGGSNDPEERACASGTRSRRATETRKHAAPDGGISKRSQRSRKMRTRRGEPSIR